MLPENKTNPSERYLLCNFLIPDITLAAIKLDVINFMANREKDEFYHKFINWRKESNEICVSTMYAYADVLLPKQFDVIFQPDNPTNFINIEFTLSQSVLNGWTVVNEMSHGHKHFAVLQFQDGIPSILNSLPWLTENMEHGKQTSVGFCNKTDFIAIKNKMLHYLRNENF